MASRIMPTLGGIGRWAVSRRTEVLVLLLPAMLLAILAIQPRLHSAHAMGLDAPSAVAPRATSIVVPEKR